MNSGDKKYNDRHKKNFRHGKRIIILTKAWKFWKKLTKSDSTFQALKKPTTVLDDPEKGRRIVEWE